MNPEPIITQLEKVGDPERQKVSDWYFPTSMKTLGVKAADLRTLLKTWWPELKNYSPDQMVAFAKALVESSVFECTQVAYELLWKHKKALGSLALDDLEFLAKCADNWATTDAFATLLSGWAWRNQLIRDEDILRWLRSENRWWRRIAVVSTVGMNLRSRGGTGDTKRTLMVCERVKDDRDDMVVKALSWALRELSKHDRMAVEQFITKYNEQLAGRVRREVTTKLNTGRKY
jgi:3-methyladenine DNA glycosylase AlkD